MAANATVEMLPCEMTECGTRQKLSIIATVTNQGKSTSMLIDQSFNDDRLIRFLGAWVTNTLTFQLFTIAEPRRFESFNSTPCLPHLSGSATPEVTGVSWPTWRDTDRHHLIVRLLCRAFLLYKLLRNLNHAAINGSIYAIRLRFQRRHERVSRSSHAFFC